MFLDWRYQDDLEKPIPYSACRRDLQARCSTSPPGTQKSRALQDIFLQFPPLPQTFSFPLRAKL